MAKDLTKVLKYIKRRFKSSRKRNKLAQSTGEAQIIPRAQHPISRKAISVNALKVMRRLNKAGFNAYLVGGSVRDLLLGREPKDFDVATDALPEQVRKIFRNCRLIGKRFRLAHVYFRDELIEVATFRAGGDRGDDQQSCSRHGLLVRDNVYGTLEDDVWRRDFTVNALYYNIADFSVVDFTGGVADIEKSELRMIGDPEARYREDPVRMLRAVRFAAKLSFKIHPETEAPLNSMASLLDHISNARLFDESIKLFLGGYAAETFAMLRHYRLFQQLFALTEEALGDTMWHQVADVFIMRTMESTDRRVSQGQPVTPAFLFAALLWYPIKKLTMQLEVDGFRPHQAFEKAMQKAISEQTQLTAIPRRLVAMMREIWLYQPLFERRSGKRPLKLLHQPRFRAAYDFLLLRAEAEPELKDLADWWTKFQAIDDEERLVMLEQYQKHPRYRKKSKSKSEEKVGNAE